MSDIPNFPKHRIDPKNSSGVSLVEGLNSMAQSFIQSYDMQQEKTKKVQSSVDHSDALYQLREFYAQNSQSYIDNKNANGLSDVLDQRIREVSAQYPNDIQSIEALLKNEKTNLMLKSVVEVEKNKQATLRNDALISVENLIKNPTVLPPSEVLKELKALYGQDIERLYGAEEAKKIVDNATIRLYQNSLLQTDPETATQWIEKSDLEEVEKRKLLSFVQTRKENSEKAVSVADEYEQYSLLRGGDVSKIQSKDPELFTQIYPLIGKDSNEIEKIIAQTEDPKLVNVYSSFLAGQTQALYNDPLKYAGRSGVMTVAPMDLNNPDWQKRATQSYQVQSIYGVTAAFDGDEIKELKSLYGNGDFEALKNIASGAFLAFPDQEIVMNDLNKVKDDLGTDLRMSAYGELDFIQLQNAKASIAKSEINPIVDNSFDKFKRSGKLFDQMPDEGKRILGNFAYVSEYSPIKYGLFNLRSKDVDTLFKESYKIYTTYFAPNYLAANISSFKENALFLKEQELTKAGYSASDMQQLQLKNIAVDKYVLGLNTNSALGFRILGYFSAQELANVAKQR